MDILMVILLAALAVGVSFIGIVFNQAMITIYMHESPRPVAYRTKFVLSLLLYIPFVAAIVAGILIVIEESKSLRG